MNIDCIYEKLNKDLCYDLMGELILDDEKIIWSYNIEMNTSEIDDNGISEEEVEFISIEEKLQEAHFNDLNLIKSTLNLMVDKDKLYFTEPILNYNTVVFEFFEY